MKNIKIVSIIFGVFIFVALYITGGNIMTCFVVGVVAAMGAYFLEKVLDLRKKEKLKKSYEMDLPDLMIHTAMFIEAGLGIKEALEKAVMAGKTEKPLYKDLYSVFELERKIGSKDFSIILQEMAEKQKVPPLSNFSALIIQNLRKGSGELCEIFTAQAQIYRNERKRTAGKLADEAATLLLIPSTIVLIALVILLIAPALMAFVQEI